MPRDSECVQGCGYNRCPECDHSGGTGSGNAGACGEGRAACGDAGYGEQFGGARSATKGPGLPRADLSLIGGIAGKVDTVHNRLSLKPFGGGNRYLIYFDERTRILSGGRETTVLAIHPGDRVYVDTQALGPRVFARTIHVRGSGGSAQASGQVVEVSDGQVRMEDRLSGQTIQLAVSDRTKIVAHGSPSSVKELHSGSLIDVTLVPGKEQSDAQSITILASPGDSYTFAGVLTHVDLSEGVLALDNRTDGNNYELYFDPLAEKSVNKLVVGAPVSVIANFDGKRYRATSIKVKDAASDR